MTDETQIRVDLIRQMFAADRGKKPDDATLAAYQLALKRMDTTKLARVVEKLLGGFERGDSEHYRVPQPGALWRLARELRTGSVQTEKPTPPLELHGAPEQRLDGWDTNANLLLLAYLDGKRGAGVMARYAPDSRIYGEACTALHVGPHTHERTAVLVKWKKLWARDMRENRELYDGKLDGKKAWADCMASAEREIDALVAAEQVAA